MARGALIDHRPWLLLGIVAALAYYILWNNPVGGVWLIALKGVSVITLAVYTMQRASGSDALLLTSALVLSALGTMAVELYFRSGWTLFALSHLVATALFLRNRKADLSRNRIALATVLLVGTPVAAWFLTHALSAAIYTCILGSMAAAAWISRFARRHVGAGVIALIVADLLAFTRTGVFDTGQLPELLAWPLYFAGLLMVATGIVQTLRGDGSAGAGGNHSGGG